MAKKINKAGFLPAKIRRVVPPHEMLRTLRELQELSQNELAELTGISHPISQP